MTELHHRMVQDMKLRGLKDNTQRAYLDSVKDLAQHYGRSPDRLTEEQLRQYFLHLRQDRRCAPSTLRVRLFGIKFLFRHTLRRRAPVLELIRLCRQSKLPVVLGRPKARHLIARIRRPAAHISALLIYSCGLRVSSWGANLVPRICRHAIPPNSWNCHCLVQNRSSSLLGAVSVELPLCKSGPCLTIAFGPFGCPRVGVHHLCRPGRGST